MSTSFVFGIGNSFWMTYLRILMQNREFSEFDVLFLAASLIVSVGIIIAYICVMQRFATRDLRSKRSMGPPKGATWVEQIRGSSRLAWAMIGFAAATYLATLGGLTSAIVVGRSFPRVAAEYRSLTIYVLLMTWVGICLSWTPWIFRALARRWSRQQIPPNLEAVDRMLWDRELDHEFVGESRSVS